MAKVFGHISPDTDTVGSAILWAWYLNTHTTQDATAHVLGTLNKETLFVLQKWGVAEPELLESLSPNEDVIIVDTNNPQELLPNICDTNILHIIDHHRLVGGLATDRPVEVTMKPLASTASVIYDLIDKNIELPREMAGILLSCILSDTLAFRSPTTTPHDKDIAEKIAADLGINIEDYSNEMFAAKSDTSDFTAKGLVHLDSKKTALGEKNIRVSVVETTNPELLLNRKGEIVEAIKEIIAEESDTDDILFFIIDIFKEEATVLTYNDFTKSIVSTSFEVSVTSDTEVLPGIVSRKKQIIPALKLAE